MPDVVEVKNLTKKFGTLVAVDDVSFSVRQNEVFGLLGENGAGKTTTLEMIEGLRKPTGGKITVLGHSHDRDLRSIKERIGVQLQSSAYFKFLTVREILDLFASLYKKRIATDTLLDMVGLAEKANAQIGKLSGGQKQRFSIIASLVNDPEVVFLDEPTTGLDPLARRSLWHLITDIKARGKTIILTTHYMEEAETLCDRIAIMDRGKIITMGEPHQLIKELPEAYRLTCVIREKIAKVRSDLGVLGTVKSVAGKDYLIEAAFATAEKLNQALRLIVPLDPEDLIVRRATLEDLFVHLTGKNIKE